MGVSLTYGLGRANILFVVDVFSVGTVCHQNGKFFTFVRWLRAVDIASYQSFASFQWHSSILLEDVGKGRVVHSMEVPDFVRHDDGVCMYVCVY
jgi:hypothetical protein